VTLCQDRWATWSSVNGCPSLTSWVSVWHPNSSATASLVVLDGFLFKIILNVLRLIHKSFLGKNVEKNYCRCRFKFSSLDLFRYTEHERYARFEVLYLVAIKTVVLWYTILHRKFVNYIYFGGGSFLYYSPTTNFLVSILLLCKKE
jgi:hypothetical protein